MEIFQTVFDWYMANLNYFTIYLLMAIESSFIPFPSEIVVPFAAWKAGEGTLTMWGVILSSTAGAMTGAVINYYLAMWIGRPVLYRLADTRWAHLLLITRESVEKAEKYFVKHGKASTFVGRLVPAVRQLISLPAGLARMNIGHFLLYTFLGATLWNMILAVIGYYAYDKREHILPYIDWIMYAVGAIFVLWLSWKGYQLYRNRKKTSIQ
ncbi:MAG: DedA family protein [Bacteroidales bacterium]|nr:DedA family protein [Bacteroidales bacterium]HOC48449.1 DedA family protein [Bacteroidales bacterium]HPS98142.1 DedA family protein [Bacteroidales bacterium]